MPPRRPRGQRGGRARVLTPEDRSSAVHRLFRTNGRAGSSETGGTLASDNLMSSDSDSSGQQSSAASGKESSSAGTRRPDEIPSPDRAGACETSRRAITPTSASTATTTTTTVRFEASTDHVTAPSQEQASVEVARPSPTHQTLTPLTAGAAAHCPPSASSILAPGAPSPSPPPSEAIAAPGRPSVTVIARVTTVINSIVSTNLPDRQRIINRIANELWLNIGALEDPRLQLAEKEWMVLMAGRAWGLKPSALVSEERRKAALLNSTEAYQPRRIFVTPTPPTPTTDSQAAPRTALLPTPAAPSISAGEESTTPFTLVQDRHKGRSTHPQQPPGKQAPTPRPPARIFRRDGPKVLLHVEVPAAGAPAEDQLSRWALTWATQLDLANHTVRVVKSHSGFKIAVSGNPQSSAWTRPHSVQIPKGEHTLTAAVRAFPSGRSDPLTTLVLTTGEGQERITRSSLVAALGRELQGVPYRLDAMGVFARGSPGSADEASSIWLFSMAVQESTMLKAIPILQTAVSNHPNRPRVQAPHRSNRFILEDGSICSIQGTPGVSIMGLPIRISNETATQQINIALGSMGLPSPAISTVYRTGKQLLVRASYLSKDYALQVATALEAGLVVCMGTPLCIGPSQSARVHLLQADGRCHFCGRKQAEGKHGFSLCYGGSVRQSKKCQGCGSTAHQATCRQCPHYSTLMAATIEELNTPTSRPVPHTLVAANQRTATSAPPQATYGDALRGGPQHRVTRPTPHVPPPPHTNHHDHEVEEILPRPPSPPQTRTTEGTRTYTHGQQAHDLLDLLEAASYQLSTATRLRSMDLSMQDQQRLREIVSRLRADSLHVQQMITNSVPPCTA